MVTKFLRPRPHSETVCDPRIDDAVTVRRCASHRKALSPLIISYGAELLYSEPTARWVVRNGVAVDVSSLAELDFVLGTAIAPRRVCVHLCDGSWAPIRRGVTDGVGSFVVKSGSHCDILAAHSESPQNILLDLGLLDVEPVVAELIAAQRIRLMGVHVGLPDSASLSDGVADALDRMAELRSEFGVLPTRLSLSNVSSLRCQLSKGELTSFSDAINDAVDDGCIRNRFPRPRVSLGMSGVTVS